MKMSKLKYGDTIGVFSPSSPVSATSPKRYVRGIEYLKSKGFNLLEGRLTGKEDYYRSGSIVERADELNALIRNPKVRCIISTIGGMNSNALLPYIDYNAFKNDPKIIIGYSDVTAILHALYAKTGITTFYGPAVAASFGEFEPFNEMTYNYFKNMLVEDGDTHAYFEKPPVWTEQMIPWETQAVAKAQNENKWLTLSEGCASGRLIIGNLSTMSGFWGSPYMLPIKSGDILFIEDSLKNAATLERLFSLLKVNGVFEKIGGLILGKHELFNDQGSGRKPYEILEEVMGSYDFPFLAEVDCCHTHPMFTMPIGKRIHLDATGQKIILEESVF